MTAPSKERKRLRLRITELQGKLTAASEAARLAGARAQGLELQNAAGLKAVEKLQADAAKARSDADGVRRQLAGVVRAVTLYVRRWWKNGVPLDVGDEHLLELARIGDHVQKPAPAPVAPCTACGAEVKR